MRSPVCVARLVIVVLALAIAVAGCRPRDVVSTSQEVQIGQQAAAQVERQYGVSSDAAMNARVDAIGQTLVRFSDRQDIKYTFKVLNVADVNAFSLPGGWVYINKGLMNAVGSDDNELAGVIGHEIGHIVARHHADLIGRQFYANILVGALTQGDVSRIAGFFANLTLLKYSRQQEYAADRLGLNETFLSKRYNPEGLITFFQRLLKLQSNPPSEFEQIFQTHPLTSDRIKAAQDHLNGLKDGSIKP